MDAAATPGDVATLAWSAGSGNPCSFKALADDESSATFACAFPFRKSSDCVAEYEQSPSTASRAAIAVDPGHDDRAVWVRRREPAVRAGQDVRGAVIDPACSCSRSR